MSSNRQIYSIQFLRGVAAFLVVIHHACNFLFDHRFDNSLDFKIGAIGVDIFFVISGFIMFYSTMRHDGTIYATLDFWKKRIIRVVPLYWLITAAVVVAGLIFPKAFSAPNASVKDFVMSLTFLPYLNSSGEVQPIIGQGWTLNYEALFYLILGATLIFVRKNLIFVLFVLFTLMNLVGGLVSESLVLVDFFASPLLYEFLAGMVVAWLYLNGRLPNGRLLMFLAIFGTFGLVADPGFHEYVASAWHRVAVWGVYAVIIVMACLRYEGAFVRRCPQILIFLGNASYSIYLTHVLAFAVIWKVVSKHPSIHGFPKLSVLCLLIAFAICIGSLVYWLIERNLINLFRTRRVASPA